jgi:hypothetical protein
VIADRVYRTYLRTPPSWRSGERVSVEAEVTSTFCAATPGPTTCIWRPPCVAWTAKLSRGLSSASGASADERSDDAAPTDGQVLAALRFVLSERGVAVGYQKNKAVRRINWKLDD